MRHDRWMTLPAGATLLTASVAMADDRPLVRPAAATVAPHAGDASTGSLASSGAARSFTQELLPTGIALGATLLVIVLARSAVKRFGGRLPGAKRPQGVVEVLARYPVARGQHVVLLKVGRRVIVAHQGPQGMQPLSEFTGDSDVADLMARCEAGARERSGFSFDALLRQSDASLAGKSSARSARQAGRALDPRDALPELMRGAEIETVDLTRRKRGGA
jgi:flagellar biogenesis protein FliO